MMALTEVITSSPLLSLMRRPASSALNNSVINSIIPPVWMRVAFVCGLDRSRLRIRNEEEVKPLRRVVWNGLMGGKPYPELKGRWDTDDDDKDN